MTSPLLWAHFVWDKCGLKAKNFAAVENFELFGAIREPAALAPDFAVPLGWVLLPSAIPSYPRGFKNKQGTKLTPSISMSSSRHFVAEIWGFLWLLLLQLRILRSSCPGFGARFLGRAIPHGYRTNPGAAFGISCEHFQERRMQQSCSGCWGSMGWGRTKPRSWQKNKGQNRN